MKTAARIRLLGGPEHADEAVGTVVTLPNDADPSDHAAEIADAARVELHFPTFTDGRAYTQAWLVRRRMGFKGDLRATGEVLVDQLQQLERMGFSSAVLGADIDIEDARRQLERFTAFYQGDVTREAPYREGSSRTS
jgi:uncharacterized protein (DUF934 family)